MYSGTINCGTNALTSGNISSGSVNSGTNSITSGNIISSGTINISDTSSTLLPAQLYSTSLGVGSANGLYLGKNVTQSLYLGYSYQGNYNNANEISIGHSSISPAIRATYDGKIGINCASSPTDTLEVSGNIKVSSGSNYIYTNKLYPVSGSTQTEFSNISCGSINAYTNTLTFGNINASGNFTCLGSKSFAIPHPTKQHCILRHCVVETNTCGDNLYRYQIDINDITNPYTITLPEYFSYINDNIQIWINRADGFGMGYGTMSEDNNRCSINVNTIGKYNVLIIGTRKDQYVQSFIASGGVEQQI